MLLGHLLYRSSYAHIDIHIIVILNVCLDTNKIYPTCLFMVYMKDKIERNYLCQHYHSWINEDMRFI